MKYVRSYKDIKDGSLCIIKRDSLLDRSLRWLYDITGDVIVIYAGSYERIKEEGGKLAGVYDVLLVNTNTGLKPYEVHEFYVLGYYVLQDEMVP